MVAQENILTVPQIHIDDIIKESGLGLSAFASKYHIPRRTVEDWHNNKRTPPLYVMELLEFKVMHDINNGEDSSNV